MTPPLDKRAQPALPRCQRGVSLLEVLVAVLVVSIGLLGLGGLQASGLRTNYSAYLRSQAAQFAFDMTDRIRANRASALAGNYDRSLGDSPPAGASVLHDADVKEWLAQLATLPSGDGAIDVDAASGAISVTIQWDDSRGGGGAQEQMRIETRL